MNELLPDGVYWAVATLKGTDKKNPARRTTVESDSSLLLCVVIMLSPLSIERRYFRIATRYESRGPVMRWEPLIIPVDSMGAQWVVKTSNLPVGEYPTGAWMPLQRPRAFNWAKKQGKLRW
jgi:hypothetical protein